MTKRATTIVLAAAAGIALCGLVLVQAGEKTWVSADGGHHAVHGHAMFIGGEGEAFDLADLADGETRVFGAGDKQVTAARTGDEVTIHRPAQGDDSELRVTCSIGRDTCKIMTVDGDTGKVAIMIQKTRECVDGEGDCDEAVIDVGLLGGGDAHTITVRKVVACDDEGNCTEDVTEGGEPHGVHVFSVGADAGAEGEVVFVTRDDGAVLRCPEGDTTMRVEKKEAEDVFLCPKHSVPLEKVAPHGKQKIRVRKSE